MRTGRAASTTTTSTTGSGGETPTVDRGAPPGTGDAEGGSASSEGGEPAAAKSGGEGASRSGTDSVKTAETKSKPMKLPALPLFGGEEKDDEGAFSRWLAKLEKHAELLRWSSRDKLLQFELHLTGRRRAPL